MRQDHTVISKETFLPRIFKIKIQDLIKKSHVQNS